MIVSKEFPNVTNTGMLNYMGFLSCIFKHKKDWEIIW